VQSTVHWLHERDLKTAAEPITQPSGGTHEY
jgi:hypothetical protein